MFPFRPQKLGSQAVQLGAAVARVQLPAHTRSAQVDNRGVTDVLLEVGDTAPQDPSSFRIPPKASQVITVGDAGSLTLSLKRPDGSAQEVVYICAGAGW